MRQPASTITSGRVLSSQLQSQLKTPRQISAQHGLMPTENRFFREVSDEHPMAICETLTRLTSANQMQQGWILVVAPNYPLSKQLLEQYQIDCQRLLLISQKQVHHYDNLMRDALTCSTCSAVVSFLPQDSDALKDYQYLANKYQTLLVNHSTNQQITH